MVDILYDIESYRPQMTITQLIKFFKSNGMDFTKTMIQNYVRTKLIPPPVEQRYYVKNHIILLCIIYELKPSFSLDEIKFALDKADGCDLTEFYMKLKEFTDMLSSAWDMSIEKIMKNTEISEAVITAGIMAHSSALKRKYLS